MSKILLCSDLDRTLLPNGAQAESPRARPMLRAFAARPEVSLAYVSGRHLALVQAAIAEYDIPPPDFAIGDVGTTSYEVSAGGWHLWPAWAEEIAPDWRGRRHDELARLLDDVGELVLQEDEKQGAFKLSYYLDPVVARAALLDEVGARLAAEKLRANLIWSVDETNNQGLLDVLPASANKLHAIRFLMARRGFAERETVFAGDSGNDLQVLSSGLPAILVRNATAEVRAQAQAQLTAAGHRGSLYLAQGGWAGMNGNYSAGVLEGVAHYFPALKAWLETQG